MCWDGVDKCSINKDVDEQCIAVMCVLACKKYYEEQQVNFWKATRKLNLCLLAIQFLLKYV